MTSSGGAKSVGAAATRVDGLPAAFPPWAVTLAELYFSGTTSTFLLSGNVFDVFALGDGSAGAGAARFGSLGDFLAEQLFGRFDLVLHYDLARGLRPLAGPDDDRHREMMALANRRIGDLTGKPLDPTMALLALDRFLQKNVMAKEAERLSVAVLVSHAAFLLPRDERASPAAQTHVVTLLNWATSPYLKRMNAAFVLIDQRASDLSERVTANPHVASLAVPLPDGAARRAYLGHLAGDADPAGFSDLTLDELAAGTAGVALTDLAVLVRSASEGGRRLDRARFRDLKKTLIERQAQSLVAFIEPRFGLELLIGHEAAKRRLLDDAKLIQRGALDSVPMGYLVCGPVGTGKTFLATCVAGSMGMPCVELKNFRSKFVGETEGNLERILTVLRGMGPVLVIVDEADAMLGDREQSGDSGVSSRVFGMIARQMGDTAYRGRIVWMLLTARPDLLPIDLKRQGRAEIHIPLFYPTEQWEIRDLFVVMAKKLGARLSPDDVPPVPFAGHLSGADIEGLVGRAQRAALLAGEPLGRAHLEAALAGFLPSTQSLERELQETAAMLECTDVEFLPPTIREKMAALGGREALSARLGALSRQISGR